MNGTFLTAALLSTSPLFSQPADTAFHTYVQRIPGTSLEFRMAAIKGGTFEMGSGADKQAKANEAPQRTVALAPFWMGAYEVTYDEYEAFTQDEGISQNSQMDAVTRPSQPYIDMTLGMGKSGGFPANSMQQYGALMYCRWLYQKTGVFYRLPTEAEWEYACRAGAKTVYPFGNEAEDLVKYAWHKSNSTDKYQKVGQLQPNAWGLYDMLGNVAEWTLDQYDDEYLAKMDATAANPMVKPTTRHPRTVRGGSFRDEAKDLRPAARLASDPIWNRRDPQIPKSKWWNADAPFVGFRLVRPATQPSAAEIEAFFETHLLP